MLTMPKCHNCGKFCRPVEWKMIYSGALLEPQEEIYKCAACVERHGSFAPQEGIKPEHSCGRLTHNFVLGRLPCCVTSLLLHNIKHRPTA